MDIRHPFANTADVAYEANTLRAEAFEPARNLFGALGRGAPDDDPPYTRIQQSLHGWGAAHSASNLQPHVGISRQTLDETGVQSDSVLGAVKIDHVDPLTLKLLVAAQEGGGRDGIRGFVGEIALVEPHTPAGPQVQ